MRRFTLLRTTFLAVAVVTSVGVEPVGAAGNVTDVIVFNGVATVTKVGSDAQFDFKWQGTTCKIESGGMVEDCTTTLPNASVATSTPCPGITGVTGTVTIARSSGANTIQGTMASTNVFGIGAITGSGITCGGTGSYTATGGQASTFEDSDPWPPPAANPCLAPIGTVYHFDAEGTIIISD